MIKNIFDYMDTIEYPGNDLLVEGIKDGVSFDCIPNAYLNGFINFVNLIDGYMIRRYKILEKYLVEKYGTYDQSIIEGKVDPNNLTWERSCQLIDKESEETRRPFYHTCQNYDDMMLLGKQSNSYWIFWVDCEGKESCIGRIPMSTFNSDDEAKEALKVAALEFSTIDVEKEDEKIKQIPMKLFSEWVTL